MGNMEDPDCTPEPVEMYRWWCCFWVVITLTYLVHTLNPYDYDSERSTLVLLPDPQVQLY